MNGKRYEKEDIASWPEGHRRCTKCFEVLPFDNFHKHADCMFGINTVCKKCRLPNSKKNYENQSTELRLWNSARYRAKKHDIPFTISVSDINIPKKCPVFGVDLVRGIPNHQYAPSLDQISPRKGYTLDNIVVMSRRANILKNDATAEELEMIAAFIKQQGGII